MNAPQQKRRRGGQPGNRNALKTGCHTAQMRALRREVSRAIAQVKLGVAMAKLCGSKITQRTQIIPNNDNTAIGEQGCMACR